MDIKIYNQKEVILEGQVVLTAANLRWIKAEDYDKLQAKLQKAEADNKVLVEFMKSIKNNGGYLPNGDFLTALTDKCCFDLAKKILSNIEQ